MFRLCDSVFPYSTSNFCFPWHEMRNCWPVFFFSQHQNWRLPCKANSNTSQQKNVNNAKSLEWTIVRLPFTKYVIVLITNLSTCDVWFGLENLPLLVNMGCLSISTMENDNRSIWLIRVTVYKRWRVDYKLSTIPVHLWTSLCGLQIHSMRTNGFAIERIVVWFMSSCERCKLNFHYVTVGECIRSSKVTELRRKKIWPFGRRKTFTLGYII